MADGTCETVGIDTIDLDEDIYPRTQRSQKTVEAYAEALRSGAVFPPVEVQRVRDNGSEHLVLIDGWHRIGAYRENAIREVPVYHWREETLEKKTHLKELRVRSITANLTHGDRLSSHDRQAMCAVMAEADPGVSITEEEFASIFGVTQKTVNNWIGAIRARQRGTRDNLILRLSMLGWTQQEIGEKVGLTQSAIAKTMNSSNLTEIHNSLTSGKSIAEVAEFHGLDIPVTWAIVLRDADDQTRLERLDRRPSIYDVWSFNARDEKYGMAGYKWGLICGQIIENLLYLYTQPGETVLDPMAGGGTTNDVCLVFGRRCDSFDIEPARDDIRQHDLTTGPPPVKRPARLAVLEPPYYNMKQKDAYGSLDEYLDFLRMAIENTANCVVNGGHIALILMDQVTRGRETDLCTRSAIGEAYIMLKAAGLTCDRLVALPLTTEQYNEQQVIWGKKTKILLGINRQMWVFRKEAYPK